MRRRRRKRAVRSNLPQTNPHWLIWLLADDFLRDIWAPRPFISAGGYTRDQAIAMTDKHSNELTAFGRDFISNVRPALFRYSFGQLC